MSEEIIKVLDALSDKLGVAIDWTKDNVAPYIEELLIRLQHYLLVMDIVGFILCIAGIVLPVLAIKKLIKYCNDDYFEDFEELLVAGEIVLFIIFIVCIIGLFVNGSNLLQSITFPELRILHYIQDLI